MRIKLFIIIGLVLAVLTAATAGTLSSYTAAFEGDIGIVPDTDKIISMYYDNLNPADYLKPNYALLPQGVDVIGSLIISNSSLTITNNYGFVAFTGSITKTKPNPKLQIGRNNDAFRTYLLFFESGTEIFFSDGTVAVFGGFYTVSAGLDILNDDLYTISGNKRTLKSNNNFKLCTEIADTAAAHGIPLIIRQLK